MKPSRIFDRRGFVAELGSVLGWPSWAWNERSDGMLVEPPTDPDALVHGWLLVWARQGMTICEYACGTRERARIAHQAGFVLANEFVTWSGPKVGQTFVSRPVLAARLHTSKHMVSKVLEDLCRVGVLERVKRPGQATLTVLSVPEVPTWRTRPSDDAHHAISQPREGSGRFAKVGLSDGPGGGSVAPTHSEASDGIPDGPCHGPGSGSVNGEEVGPSTVGGRSVARATTEVVNTDVPIDVETNVSSSPSGAGFDDRRVTVRRLGDDLVIEGVHHRTAEQMVADGTAAIVDGTGATSLVNEADVA